MTQADRPISCLVTGGRALSENFKAESDIIVDIAERAAAAGVSMIQIRERRLTAGQIFDLARRVVQRTCGRKTLVTVNDRADIAIAAGADGVHLRSDSIDCGTIRKCFPPDFLIGVSTHTAGEVAGAAQAGADYAFFGPVFETVGKAAQGIDALRRAVSRLPDFPVIAIGGINAENYEDVIDAGAAGFAAIRAFENLEKFELSQRVGEV